MTPDQLIKEIAAEVATIEPKGMAKTVTREAQIGQLAAKGLAECADSTIAAIQDSMQAVQDAANEIVTNGNQLIDAIRVHSKGFQDRVTSFTRLQESISIQVKQAKTDISTFDGS